MTNYQTRTANPCDADLIEKVKLNKAEELPTEGMALKFYDSCANKSSKMEQKCRV
jgi:hypothetical protein